MNHADERVPFDDYATYKGLVLDVLGAAESELIVYDEDLAQTGLESIAGIKALEKICRGAHTTAALRVLVRSPRFIERECPRLLKLIADYGHRIEVRVTSKGTKTLDQVFILTDTPDAIVRFHDDGPRGKAFFCDSATVSQYREHFETMWSCARKGPTGISLGL